MSSLVNFDLKAKEEPKEIDVSSEDESLLDIIFNKLSLSHIKETFAINREQNIIDLSSKLSSSEVIAISVGS